MHGLGLGIRKRERSFVHRDGREISTVWMQKLGAEEVGLVAFSFCKVGEGIC